MSFLRHKIEIFIAFVFHFFSARKTLANSAVSVVLMCRKFGVEVRDFGSSWRDGVAFAALINSLRPELVDMSVCAHNSPRDNLEHAFTVAEEHLGIPRLLDVEGMKHMLDFSFRADAVFIIYFRVSYTDGVVNAACLLGTIFRDILLSILIYTCIQKYHCLQYCVLKNIAFGM